VRAAALVGTVALVGAGCSSGSSNDGAKSASGVEVNGGTTPTTYHDHQKMLHDQALARAGHHHAYAAHAAHQTHAGTEHASHASGTTHDAHLAHEVGTTGAHDHTVSGSTATHHDHGSTSTGGTTGHDHGTSGGTTGTTGGHNHGGDGTTEDWETVRYKALTGGLDAATIAARSQVIADYVTQQIRNRSGLIRSLPADEAQRRIDAYASWTVAHALDTEHGSGADGNHTHGPLVWQSMDAATTAQMNAQLVTSAAVPALYPTAADAQGAGYFQVTPWTPGIGAHYLNVNYVFDFDPAHPSILLYNGNSPSSAIVGVSYAVYSGAATPPEGFAGPNDPWHEHPALCIVGTFVIGADNTPADLCASVGGTKGNGFGGGHLWMMHLWQVPGWSSSWGLFSGENPEINLRRADFF